MRRRRDEGSIHVLEAVTAAVLMMSTLAFVLTFDMAPSGSSVTQDILMQRVEDVGFILNDTPTGRGGSCDGNTEEEKYLIDGLGGDSTRWRTRMNDSFGQGRIVGLVLENGRGTYEVHEGPANAAKGWFSKPFRPEWSYIFPIFQKDSVAGNERLVIDVPVYLKNELLRPEGEAIKTIVTLDGLLQDPELVTYSLAGVPGHRQTTVFRPFAQNITWLDPLDPSGTRPDLVRNLTASELTKRDPLRFRLRIEPSLGGVALDTWSIPEGMHAFVRLPPGWAINSVRMEGENPHWRLAPTGNNHQGWVLNFTLQQSVSEPETILVYAMPPEHPARSFDDFHARLGNASLGESTLVVRYPPVATETDLPRVIYATTPYPMRAGTRALLGVVFANGGEDVSVKGVTFQVPGGYVDQHTSATRMDGYALFADAPILVPGHEAAGMVAPGWSRSPDGKNLTWRASASDPARLVKKGEATMWNISVEVTSDPLESTWVDRAISEGVVSTITFPNGYKHTSTRWGPTMGVVRHEIPPESTPGANDGYPWRVPTPPEESVSYPITIDIVAKGAWNRPARLSNTTTYTVRATSPDAVALGHASANSTFSAKTRLIPLGSVFQLDASLGSIADALSTKEVNNAKLEVSLYAPSSLGCKPLTTWKRDLNTLPVGAIRDVRVWDPLGGIASKVYLTGDDKRAYAVDQDGRSLWSHRLSAAGLKLEVASFGPTEKRVVVGEEMGRAIMLDAITGLPRWSISIARSGPAETHKTPNGVTGLAVDEAGARILVATNGGALELLNKEGTPLARHEALDGYHYTQLAFGPSGRIYALRVGPEGVKNKILRFDDDLEVQAYSSLPSEGFSIGTVGILAAEGTWSGVLDPLTLVRDSRYQSTTHAATIGMIASGDATGDSVADLVVAMLDGNIILHDGATAGIPWTYLVPRESGAPTRTVSNFASIAQEAPCKTRMDGEIKWDSPTECEPIIIDPNTRPLLVHAAGGNVAYVYDQGGAKRLVLLANGQPRWPRQELDPDQTPLALTQGAWPIDGAIAFTTLEGRLFVHAKSAGTELLDTKPSEFAGTVSFQARAPGGSLYGPHVLVASITWTDSAGAHRVNLTDWVQLVKPDGTRGSHGYWITYLAEDRDDPMIPHRTG